jgi:hypothetical protein
VCIYIYIERERERERERGREGERGGEREEDRITWKRSPKLLNELKLNLLLGRKYIFGEFNFRPHWFNVTATSHENKTVDVLLN